MRIHATCRAALIPVLALWWSAAPLGADPAVGSTRFDLVNDQVVCTVRLEDGRLAEDRLAARSSGAAAGRPLPSITTDAGFTLEMMWTDWQAPGQAANAANPVMVRARDLVLTGHVRRQDADGGVTLELLFRDAAGCLEVRTAYRLDADAFFVRRTLAVRQLKGAPHFLRWIWTQDSRLGDAVQTLKPGGFGQPVAVRCGAGGAFFGLEYPAAENAAVSSADDRPVVRCGQEMGVRLGPEWTEGAPAVTGLAPDPHVKLWFWRYLETIRVAPLRPYLLYNTWYDVRAPEMVKEPGQVMNEANLLRIIGQFKTEMVAKRGLTLDAFVLDDGWDVYRSDWVLRSAEFPNGLGPIRRALAELGTRLGIWFGPTGGYSHRDWRIGWMREHGYETVGDQFCLAGRNYGRMFRQRVTDLAANDGVGYFKWDGIQFSCSEPDHGHPVDIYSRRAVMESVAALGRAVRAKDPEMFLNITSGTWLSPWWLLYADQIWMQGEDYGWADVPSISRRDAAITYRDTVLHEDYRRHDFWFPLANLMTHGIIKGHLQKLGGDAEALDKFTDETLVYVARGVSMWELYISPDLLTDGEWEAMARSLRWARDRFPVLTQTEMVGGDPSRGEAYGYVHFKGRRGILVARNPVIAAQVLRTELAPAYGLDPEANTLVLERVYPTRWVSPNLYAAGAALTLPLDGFETAVYEIYPLAEAPGPLVAGAVFEAADDPASAGAVTVYPIAGPPRLLNPERVARAQVDGRSVQPQALGVTAGDGLPEAVHRAAVESDGPGRLAARFELDPAVTTAELAVLLTPAEASAERALPALAATVDGREAAVRAEAQAGRWAWHTVALPANTRTVELELRADPKAAGWSGTASVWMVCRQRLGRAVALTLSPAEPVQSRPMPPRPWPSGEIRRNVPLGEVTVTLP